MSGHGLAEAVGGAALFLGIATVLSITVWQLLARWKVKVQVGREDEYRSLADRAIRSQENVERQLADVQARLEAIERVLKEVE